MARRRPRRRRGNRARRVSGTWRAGRAGRVRGAAADGRVPLRRSARATSENRPVIERAGASTQADARLRIVDAGVRCIAREGVAGASMAAIAMEAGVSKALLHYHYHDRSRLLAEIVEHIGVRTI